MLLSWRSGSEDDRSALLLSSHARCPWPTAPKPSHKETCGHVSSERGKGSGSRGCWGLSHRAIRDGSSKEKTSDLRVLSRRSLTRPRAGGTEVRGKDTHNPTRCSLRAREGWSWCAEGWRKQDRSGHVEGRALPSLLSGSKKSQKGFQQGHNRSVPHSKKTLLGHELVLSAAVYHPSTGLPGPLAPLPLLRRTHTQDQRSGPLSSELPLHRAARKHQPGTRSRVRMCNTRVPTSGAP